MKAALVFGIIGLASVPALARDSSHLVCSGYMAARPAPDNYGISMQFQEGRARDGNGRVESLSSIWAGNLYQGTGLNEKDDFGQNGTIVMTSKEDSNKVFYKGSYKLVKDAKTDQYKLRLKGQLNLDPDNPSDQVEKISTTLPCVNISN